MKTKRYISNGYCFSSIANMIFITNLMEEISFYKQYIEIVSKIMHDKNLKFIKESEYNNYLEENYIYYLEKIMIFEYGFFEQSLVNDLFKYLLNDLRNKFNLISFQNSIY